MTTLVLCVDLLDRSKIALARPDAVFVRTAAALAARAATDGPHVVIVDLSRPDALDAVAAAVASGAPVTAYGSHVDDERLAAARAAGAAEVLARSRYFARLG